MQTNDIEYFAISEDSADWRWHVRFKAINKTVSRNQVGQPRPSAIKRAQVEELLVAH